MNEAIQSQTIGALKPIEKWKRVLRRLLDGPLDRLEAERYPVSDHVLNSTIAELKRRGLEIHAQMIRRPGYEGRGAHVAQYTLDPASRERAQHLIGG